jgi:hypothetical protein
MCVHINVKALYSEIERVKFVARENDEATKCLSTYLRLTGITTLNLYNSKTLNFLIQETRPIQFNKSLNRHDILGLNNSYSIIHLLQ